MMEIRGAVRTELMNYIKGNIMAIVNVSSVAQRSVFRYPGGKTWLIPQIRQWISTQPNKPRKFIEPFLGGGIASLTVAFEDLTDNVIAAELDDEVAAVWHTMLSNDNLWLAQKILNFKLTAESAKLELSKDVLSVRDKAFRTIIKNRVKYGGIMTDKTGIMKSGDKGKGISARWYPDTICKRITNIVPIADKITFLEMDGLDLIEHHKHDSDVVFFIDPPYTISPKSAGFNLYKRSCLDHGRLFKLMSECVGDFVVTYDNNQVAIDMAKSYNFDVQPISMKNNKNAKMTEIIIGRNLEWLRKKE